MGDLTKDFSRSEFACKCGCGDDDISLALVGGLQRLRDGLAKPVIVVSGCRCRAHNAAVGGAANSKHLLGMAADVRVEGMTARELYEAAACVGRFGGFGVDDARNFVHLDLRGETAKWCYAAGREAAWHEAVA